MARFLVLFPYLLTSAAFGVVVIFSAVFMLRNNISDLRTWLALALTDTFIVCCIATLSLILGYGNRTMEFTPAFLKWLGGATIAEVAGIVLIVFRFFFHGSEEAGKITHKA